MTRIDRAVVLGLSAAFVLVSAAVVWSSSPAGIALETGSPSPSTAEASLGPADGTYREGVIGRPTFASPFGARSQADRDVVALVFAGLVRLAPDETVEPDLASSWTVDPTGRTYTFRLRPDATWQDGQPVTADDVVFTIQALQDPQYTGPGEMSWAEVAVRAVDAHTVEFTLTHALGGFLAALTQPIAPAHLLRDVPPARLADDPFGRQPIGAGPFEVQSLSVDEAILVRRSGTGGGSASPSPDASASSFPDASTSVPMPSPGSGGHPIDRIELHFYDTAAALVAAFRAGSLDAADGLPTRDAGALAALPGTRLVVQRLTTVSAIALNLRPSHREWRDARARRALLEAIDRDRIVTDVLGGLAERADGLLPPGSAMNDPTKTPRVAFSTAAAAKDLSAAGWKKVAGAWRAPGGKAPYRLELVAPDAASNPTAGLIAQAVAADWRAFGLTVNVTLLPAATFVDQRLTSGTFAAALVDLAIGHDPDLYPLLASSQVLAGRSNITGYQDKSLDARLVAARQAVAPAARRAAYGALETALAASLPLLPLVVQDDPLVLGPRVVGEAPRLLADRSERFDDVLTWRLANGR